MSNLEYKDKYLKYKNKYLKNKNILEQQNNQYNQYNEHNQQGGNYFSSGQYVLFLNKYQTKKSVIKDTINKRVIENFNKFTDELGSCALFLRIGSTTTGKDINHIYDTIYPNNTIFQGYTSKNAAREALKKIKNGIFRTASSIGEEGEIISKGGAKIGGGLVGGLDDGLVGGLVGGDCNGECQEEDNDKFKIKFVCTYKSFTLEKAGVSGINIPHTSDLYNKEKLISLINGINQEIEAKSACGNEISTVLIINKTGIFWEEIVIEKNISISYKPNTIDISDIKEIKYQGEF